jgi:hypothetical protein
MAIAELNASALPYPSEDQSVKLKPLKSVDARAIHARRQDTEKNRIITVIFIKDF